MRRNIQIQEHIHYHYHYTCAEDPLSKPVRKYQRKASSYQYYTPQTCKNSKDSSKDQLNETIIAEEPLPLTQKKQNTTSRSQVTQTSNAKSASNLQKYFAADRTRDRSQMIVQDDVNEGHLTYRSNIRSDLSFEVNIENNQQDSKEHYQRQIQELKKQIARLQFVQEECSYLRDKYLNHYQNVCK